jgi:aldose 1-epimerase
VGDVNVAAGGSAGRTIGRYANRIANGCFTLDGRVYHLLTNEGPTTLHGGPDGFSKRTWRVTSKRAGGGGRAVRIEFALRSPDGDQGFPGELQCTVAYQLDDAGALRIDYKAATDSPTILSLTNHAYFNLSAGASTTIAAQRLQVAASSYLPVDAAMIPTGARAPVAGTSLDFRASRPIGTEPYDCTFVVDGWDGTLRAVAEAYDDPSGRKVFVETTEPSLQLFTGKPGAFALETQHFPDAPNHSTFPSAVLRPGETFESTTIYRFTAL